MIRAFFNVLPCQLANGLTVLAFLLFALPASAQVTTGTPPFGSFGGGPDVINLANNNAHLTIPVLHKPGRGTNFTYDLSYDSSVWYPVTSGSTTTWTPVINWGWRGQTEIATGYVSRTGTVIRTCRDRSGNIIGQQILYASWVYHDPWGTPHPFVGTNLVISGTCGTGAHETFTATSDAYTITTQDGTYTSLFDSVGHNINAPINNTSGGGSTTDRNGNQITASSSGAFTDTLGTTALTVAGTAPNNTTFTYTAPSGASAPYSMSYVYYTVATNFAISNINESGATATYLVDRITLPDGTFYQFSYEATPSTPSNHACTPLTGTYQTNCVAARVVKITLPTGGYIAYSYSGGAGTNNSGIFADGSAATLTRTVNDGSTSNAWIYVRTLGTGAASTNLVTDPSNNQTNIQFQGIYETERKTYQGSTSGTLLRTADTCYNGAASPCTSTAVTLPIASRSVIDQYPSNLQCKHSYTFNSFGLLTEADDYDYGSGSSGALLRKILIAYAALGNNINAFSQTTTVQDGSGHTLAQTANNYDESTPSASSGTPQHVAVSGSRGNLTSVSQLVQGSTTLTSHFTYYDTGALLTSTDVNSAVTTFSYPDATSTCGNAFPTKASITQPVSVNTQATWNCVGGVSTSTTDVNGKVTNTAWNDPYFWRPASMSFPDTGQTSWAYNNQTSLTTTTKMTSSQNIVSTVSLDGLGRPLHGQLNSDSLGVDYVDTTYDVVGRIASVSNPYRTTSDPTYGLTSYQYDALSRTTSITLPDGSIARNSYTDNSITSTDPASKASKSVYDGLGRVTQLFEDPAGLNYESDYTYDALGNLLTVNQKGGSTNSANWRTRTFAYDGLSRPTSAITPEGGTISYGYDTNGNLATKTAPAPNQTGSATVTATYQWDVLHRLTQKSYSDGTTSTATYGYDQQAPWGWNLSNYLGRLTSQSTSAAGATQTAAIFNYDPLGRITLHDYCTPLNCTGPNPAFHVQYTYDLAGDITSVPLDYGSNLSYTTSFAYDTAGRPTSVTSNLVDSQHPGTLFTSDSSVGYFPHGALRKAALGNGLYQSNMYYNTLRPCLLDVNNSSTITLQTCNDSTPSGNVLDLAHNYDHAGNLTGWNATGVQSFIRTFGYDSLNRLSTYADSASAQSCKGLNWTYDAWGNRTDQTVTSGTCNTFHAGVGTNNRLTSPYQYDAAGNMTYDGSHYYFYDAEGRLVQVDGTFGTCSTATVCYIYDAQGHRVRRSWPAGGGIRNTDYIVGADGAVESEWNNGADWGAGFWGEGYVYLGRQQLAHYHNGTTLFVHPDHLGSTRLQTDLSQNVQVSYDYLPFGEIIAGGSGNWYTFTGNEREPSDNLDRTWFRQYGSSFGRWTSPDPLSGTILDPQSQNRYTYVRNNPINRIDPTGLADCLGGEPCFKDPGESLCDVLGCSAWDGRPTIGLGGTTHQFDLLHIPVVDSRIFEPGYIVSLDGQIYVNLPGTLTNSLNPNYRDDSYFPDNPDDPMTSPVILNDTSYWLRVGWADVTTAPITFGSISSGGGNRSTVRASPTLKFRPPSWQNFTHEFLPCYGAQVIYNFIGDDDKTYVTLGTVAVGLMKPPIGVPLLLVWTGINTFKAGAACAVASRGYYE